MTTETETATATQTAPELSPVQQAIEKLGTLPENQVAPKPEEKQQATVAQQQDYDMTGNKFFDYVTDPDKTVSKAARRDAIAELLTYNEQESPAENKKRLSQYEYFKEYMMSQLKNGSEDIIRTTDQKNMVELHDMFNEIHAALTSYGDSMGVPKAILNAITKVRESGDPRMMLNIYQCFAKEDKERDAHNLKVTNLEAQLKTNEDLSKTYEDEIARLSQITWFWGGIKGEAKQQRAVVQSKKDRLDAQIKGTPAADGAPAVVGQRAMLAYLKSPEGQPKELYPEYHDEKIQLRKLKELTGEDWLKQAQELIENSLGFTETTDRRGRVVLASQINKRDHVDELDELTDKLKGVYELLDDAEEAAATANKAIYDRLSIAAPNEDNMDKGEREKKAKAAALYMDSTERSKTDTKQVRGQLEQQSLVLSTFRSRLNDKIGDARNLIGSINAEVTSSMALTIEALGSAATDAAGMMAEDATEVIREDNNKTLDEEMKRNGSSAEAQAAKILASTERMGKFYETINEITQKTIKGLEDKNAASEKQDEMREKLQEGLKALDSAAASRITSKAPQFNEAAASATNDNAAAVTPAAPPAKRKDNDIKDKLAAF